MQAESLLTLFLGPPDGALSPSIAPSSSPERQRLMHAILDPLSDQIAQEP